MNLLNMGIMVVQYETSHHDTGKHFYNTCCASKIFANLQVKQSCLYTNLTNEYLCPFK